LLPVSVFFIFYLSLLFGKGQARAPDVGGWHADGGGEAKKNGMTGVKEIAKERGCTAAGNETTEKKRKCICGCKI